MTKYNKGDVLIIKKGVVCDNHELKYTVLDAKLGKDIGETFNTNHTYVKTDIEPEKWLSTTFFEKI